MIDFSAFQGPVSRVLRMFVRLVPDNQVVRVLQGPLRGARWIAGSSNAGCWLGSYESDVQSLLARLLRPGMVFYDLGANVGFFTLFASRLVGPDGHVYAFEPFPDNLRLIRRHIEMNHVRNVTVIEAAVADATGRARFAGSSSKGHLADDGAIEVETVVLDKLVDEGRIRPPDVVKMDVEGAELLVLRGGRSVFANSQPYVLIEFHGQWVEGVDIDTECRNLLRGLGYRLEKTGHEVLAVPPSKGAARREGQA